MKKLLIILTVVIAVPLALAVGALSGSEFQLMTGNGQEFDRQLCERDCRSRFGYELYFWSGSGPSSYWAFANCMAECDRKFWKQFDQDRQKLQEQPEYFGRTSFVK